MTFSQTLQKEVQPSDFRVQIGKTVTRFELAQAKFDMALDIRAELVEALAQQLAKHNTLRKEEQNSVTFLLDMFVIPVDDFMGLVVDMAQSMLTRISESTSNE